MDFNQIVKHYKNEVTNQEPEEFVMSADLAAEELIDNLKEFLTNKDVDMTMSYVIQAMEHYFDFQLDRYNKRQARNSQFENTVSDHIKRFSS